MLKNSIAVYCLKYAESVLPESMVFDCGDAEKNIPISFAVYLIKTKDKNILVDAGSTTMPGFNMKKFYSPAFALRTMGCTVDEITDVIITHAHHDHIEAIKYFKNAQIHISKAEHDNANQYITKDINVNIFEKEFAPEEPIKVIEIGGHSIGSSVVEIKADDIIHILAGDECYTNANIDDKICTGISCNKDKSMQFIKKYSNKKYRVHTCHDISLKTERIV